ncbi:MAG: hypothetical protein QXO00_05225 [Candidatus Bathyarchaeia archaeon]
MRILTALLALAVSSAAIAQARRTEPLQQIAESIRAIGGVCFIIIICLILASWIIFISALLHKWVRQKTRVISEKGTCAFLLGMVLIIAIAIIGGYCGMLGRHFPPATIIALLSVFTLWSAFTLGIVPVSWVIGGKIAKIAGIERDDFSTALLGALTLFLACFVPIIGWAFVLYWAIVAIGLWVVRT